eukprot:EG_transcript_521
MTDKKAKRGDGAENIKVAVRVRPLSSKEVAAGHQAVVELDLADSQVRVQTLVGTPDVWTFDYVFNNSFTQEDIFIQTVLPLVQSVMEGFNATIFAYGQSGSGKTYTMSGVLDDPSLQGITPRCFKFIFGQIAEHQRQSDRTYRVLCSFMELYNGKARDLLSRDKFLTPLAIRENKDKTFFCEDLSVHEVKLEAELYELMEAGSQRRQVAATELNSDSSRSHSIFTVFTEVTARCEDGSARVVTSKLNLVDLAGSERQSKTGAQGEILREGCNINLSLSALGSVIDTLVKGKGHVPFRSSPLTMLLKDSLGGCSKTVMFANVGPAEHNVAETISTLRFADRAKQIKNKPRVQMDPKDAKIAELEDRVKTLTDRLAKYERGANSGLAEEAEHLRQRIADLELELETCTADHQRQEAEAKAVLEDRAQQLAESAAAAAVLRQQLERCAEQAQQLEYERSLAQQMAGGAGGGGEEAAAELRGVVLDFVAEVAAAVALPDISLPDNATAAQVQSALHLLEAKLLDRAGVMEGQQAQQQQALEAELAALRAQHRAETVRLQELNDQAQEALQQSMQRLLKLKGKLEAEKDARKRLEEQQQLEKASLEERHRWEGDSVTALATAEAQLRDSRAEVQLLRQTQLAAEEATARGSLEHAEGQQRAGVRWEAQGQALRFELRRLRWEEAALREANAELQANAAKEVAVLKDALAGRSPSVWGSCDANGSVIASQAKVSEEPSAPNHTQSPTGELPAEESPTPAPAALPAPDPHDRKAVRHYIKASQALEQELREQLVAVQRESDALARQLEEAQGRMQQLHARHQEQMDDFQRKVEDTRSSAARKMEALEGEVEALEVDNRRLLQLMAAAEGEAARLTKVLQEKERTLAEVTAGADVVRHENEGLRAEFHALHRETVRLKDALRAAETRWHAEREDLEGELEALRADVVQEAERADQSQQELTRALRENDRLRLDVEVAQQDKAELRQDVMELQHRLKQAEAEASAVRRVEAKLQEAKAALDNSRHVLATQADLLEKKKQKELQLETQVAALHQKVMDTCREAQAHLQAEVDRLTRGNNQKMQELVLRHQDQLAAQRQEFSAERDALNKKIQKGRLALQKVRERYDAECVNSHELCKAVEDLKANEMKRLRSGGDEARQAIEDQKGDIRNMVRMAQAARQMRILGLDPDKADPPEPHRTSPEGRRQDSHPRESDGLHHMSHAQRRGSAVSNATVSPCNSGRSSQEGRPDPDTCRRCGQQLKAEEERVAVGEVVYHAGCLVCCVCEEPVPVAKCRVSGGLPRHAKCKVLKKKKKKFTEHSDAAEEADEFDYNL